MPQISNQSYLERAVHGIPRMYDRLALTLFDSLPPENEILYSAFFPDLLALNVVLNLFFFSPFDLFLLTIRYIE